MPTSYNYVVVELLITRACIVGECPTFTVGANVQCSPSCEGITVGSTIMFSCKPGYEMADNQAHAAICKADRTWSLSSAPVCKGEVLHSLMHCH